MNDHNQRTVMVSQIPGLKSVKNIIAVGSGKGGVGKSTVSVNLASALQKLGYKVGLMDADIYGPSQGGLLGGEAMQVRSENGKLLPAEKDGIKFISMSLITGKNDPVIWRAPMAMKAVTQFLNVEWGDLDYLLIDLPPGTGDIQLSLAQQASLTGAVIVTTPQHVAAGIAKKGLQMFQQVNVPILGVIENMSTFICGHCAKPTEIFKGEGGKKLADDAKSTFFGSIPLDPEVMDSGEKGAPLPARNPNSNGAKIFMGIAQSLQKEVQKSKEEQNQFSPSELAIDPEGSLAVTWADGSKEVVRAFNLRSNCPCANCVDENSGQRILDVNAIPLDIKLTTVKPVGRYGVTVDYNHPHSTGIFKFNRIKDLAQKQKERPKFNL